MFGSVWSTVYAKMSINLLRMFNMYIQNRWSAGHYNSAMSTSQCSLFTEEDYKEEEKGDKEDIHWSKVSLTWSTNYKIITKALYDRSVWCLQKSRQKIQNEPWTYVFFLLNSVFSNCRIKHVWWTKYTFQVSAIKWNQLTTCK